MPLWEIAFFSSADSWAMVQPFSGQTQRWPERQKNRHLYLTGAADERSILSTRYYNGCMMVRNRFMVDRASFCLCYLDGVKGGTVSTVGYALREGLRVLNLAMPDACERFLHGKGV